MLPFQWDTQELVLAASLLRPKLCSSPVFLDAHLCAVICPVRSEDSGRGDRASLALQWRLQAAWHLPLRILTIWEASLLFQALMRSDRMTQHTVLLCQTSAHFSQCCSPRRPPCSGDHSCHIYTGRTCPSLFSALTLSSLFRVNFAVFKTTSFYRFVTHISKHALKIRLFQPKARPAGSAPEPTR